MRAHSFCIALSCEEQREHYAASWLSFSLLSRLHSLCSIGCVWMQVGERGSTQLTFVKGLYHDVSTQVHQQFGMAHLVVGLNAGGAA